MIPLGKEEKRPHRIPRRCYICKKKFSTDDINKTYNKFRDHCYYTGKYRGAAHDICNLDIKYQKKLQ